MIFVKLAVLLWVAFLIVRFFCRGECHVRRKGCGCHWQES